MEKCILCGAELVEGKCPNAESHFKKMCLNCTFCENGICTNQENMEAVRNKVIQSLQIPGGYELEDIKLKPVQLKDPTKKCPRHTLDTELVLSELTKLAEE